MTGPADGLRKRRRGGGGGREEKAATGRQQWFVVNARESSLSFSQIGSLEMDASVSQSVFDTPATGHELKSAQLF